MPLGFRVRAGMLRGNGARRILLQRSTAHPHCVVTGRGRSTGERSQSTFWMPSPVRGAERRQRCCREGVSSAHIGGAWRCHWQVDVQHAR